MNYYRGQVFVDKVDKTRWEVDRAYDDGVYLKKADVGYHFATFVRLNDLELRYVSEARLDFAKDLEEICSSTED